ncbi:type II secretion system F family protein [Gallibacterium trehalosifermentans]|uniref:Type II secretion system F family protein n=1 Tax=Gallibacterium trehalosifermentans TaxID=516935 RepID=A0ABV6H166_9PAST
MAKYNWRGQDRFQNRIKGSIIADNPPQARQRLFQQGIMVTSLAKNWQFSSRLTLTQQSEFLLQLALLLQAEVPLKQALQLLQEHCTHQAIYQLLKQCLHTLNIGLPLSHALQAEKKLLSPHEWQLLYSGEQSGQLASVIQQLADQKKHQQQLRQQIKKILFYPLMMLVISLTLTLFLLLFIVPTFADLYAQQQQALPFLTQFLMDISAFLQHYLWFIFGLLCFIIMLCYISYARFPAFKTILLKLICVIPAIQKLYLNIQAIHFFSILATMLQAGITLQQSLMTFLPQQSLLTTKKNSLLEKEARQCLTALQQGLRFSDGLSHHFIALQTRQMLIIGENSGKLSHTLNYLATQAQQQLSTQIDLFAKLLEPLLMLVIGSIIGVIIVGMYLPIFNLGNIIL